MFCCAVSRYFGDVMLTALIEPCDRHIATVPTPEETYKVSLMIP
jgi:hypothetical protein